MSIFNIKPHVVSKDLGGYSIMMYGDPKSGKTTAATRFDKHLLLGFELGYNALPGVMALPMSSWGDFLKVLRELKKPEAKEMYATIIVDTLDIAWDLCEKYICSQNDVDKIGDIPFGQGYGMVEKEFDKQLRAIVQLQYGLVGISHSTAKPFLNPLTGMEEDRMVPTLAKKARIVCNRLFDVIGYATSEFDENENTVMKLKLRGTPRYDAGSRFSHMVPEIRFSYDQLANAIHTAIEDEAKAVNNSALFSTGVKNAHVGTEKKYDFDLLMKEFQELVSEVMSKTPEKRDLIQDTVSKHLGVGKKVSDMSRGQGEILSVIIDEIKELIK